MITIKDVSEKCGVSMATVSKALNGYSDVGEKTAEHIRAVAKELGYLPNASARALKTNKTNNIGVLFIDQTQSGLTHEYFSLVLNSLKVEAERLGYDVTFISENIGGRSMSYLEHCRYRRCDGVVIACVDFTNPAVIDLVRSEIPTVTIDYVYDGRTAIMSDNVRGVQDLMQYVYDCGHRKVAFIHGEDTSVTQKRVGSFYQFCGENHISVPTEYVLPARYHDPDMTAAAVSRLLDLKAPPTCILCPDDYAALGAIREIEMRGMQIPRDISIAGYDGIPLSRVLSPKLTTLRQDTDSLGRKAARALIDSVEHAKQFIPQQMPVAGTLQAGASVRKL